MYNLVGIAKNAVLHIWKLLTKEILKVLITREKFFNCVKEQNYYGDRFIMYTNIKSLYCTP